MKPCCNYNLSNSTAFDKYHCRCDGCVEWNKARQKKQGPRKEYHRRKHLERYGITLEQFEEMKKSCSGRCMICNGLPEFRFGKTSVLSVDHDHKTGLVRGLLCGSCNVGIGHLKSVENLEAAKKYLEKFSTNTLTS